MTGNAILAAETLGYLTGLGVEEFVVCAGARNAPLVTSLLRGAPANGCEVLSHFDERTAAFFAMGLARRSGKPVAVMTTSGTAVAELLPALIESFYSGVPLVLVTADRPVNFRGSGAPQAIEQVGIFGRYAPTALDVSVVDDLTGVAEWDRKTPLHLNICFDEPRAEDVAESWSAMAVSGSGTPPAASDDEVLGDFCRAASLPLVLLGALDPGWQEGVARFLTTSGIPFWAEGTSGLRELAGLIDTRIASESDLAALNPGSVIRIGGIPSCRFWRDLESLPDVPVLSVSTLPFTGLARESDLLVSETFPEVEIETQPCWVKDRTLLGAPTFSGDERSEPAAVRQLSEMIPSEALVFLGNSMPIREWNLAATFEISHPQCFASRGTNGIDGQIATFLGLSRGAAESWGIFGDLTALYDLNAPALLRSQAGEKRRIVILNNGGGRIFSRLPSMAGLEPDEKKHTENHHGRHFSSWAEMWDLDYAAWHPGDSFPSLESDALVIEVFPDNEATEAFWESRKQS
ncbi:MAG: 2-succinyl-5-enolpyruvyl-6-hydroxy-3-cyclohexene-1-carboxylic-acid synthase [Verrucomicrobiales bacterium]|nr:2-succinyl-5-enolpyruvyl-6-hydroxy-3-cyclohexene-1-carboxylic-acid synthase [Verrucomicrobiales bacterium]